MRERLDLDQSNDGVVGAAQAGVVWAAPAGVVRIAMVAALLGWTGIAAACNPAVPVSGERRVHPALMTRSADALIELYNRQVVVAEDIRLSATLWDLSWIVAFQEGRATRKKQSMEVAKRNIEAWRKRYIQGQTAFRVRIDLLNRPEITAGEDRMTKLREWSFKLRFFDGAVVPYQDIKVELSRRWKSREGAGHDYRLDGTVHFGRRLDPERDRWVELLAFPPGERPAATLRWNLQKP